MKDFTNEELRTLVWMCQNQGSQVYMRDIKNGRNPDDDETYKRIIQISKKVYEELTDRINK